MFETRQSDELIAEIDIYEAEIECQKSMIDAIHGPNHTTKYVCGEEYDAIKAGQLSETY